MSKNVMQCFVIYIADAARSEEGKVIGLLGREHYGEMLLLENVLLVLLELY